MSESPLPQAFSFHDLLEVRVVHAFRRNSVSLPTIRKACQHAREYFERPYPFSCQRFLTDGRTVFAEILDQAGEADRSIGQWADGKIRAEVAWFAGALEEAVTERW